MARVNVQVPRGSQHRFSEVPRAEIQRAAFDRSFGLKTAFDAGLLVPIFVDEALPGDTITVRMQAFARMLSPLRAPIMDNIYLETFFFSVPNRLLWSNWQRFCGEQDDPGDSTDYVVPRLTAGKTVAVGTLADFLGVPVGLQTGSVRVSALPFRAYYLIWNEWFRDQNLQDSMVVSRGDGPDNYGDAVLARRGKRHDYFTSCLPWPQKGDPVALPLSGQAPVYGIGKHTSDATAGPITVYDSTNKAATMTYPWFRTMLDTPSSYQFSVAMDGDAPAWPDIRADLSQATGATINELRQAFQVQRLLERDARGGTRYTEILKSHFGVSSDDARLQRPEYLGGGRSMVTVSPIAQTSSTDVTSPQGNLAAVGTVEASGHGFAKSFTEHCTLIGLACVRADLTYQQGLERMWSRETRYDFYWPVLAQLGEQAVLNREIYVSNAAADDAVWGYQERYAEYRYKPSLVTGIMRSNVAGSLDIWHLAQDFAALPVLNGSFISEDPPIDRVVAAPDEPHFVMDAFFKFRAARPLPLYGVPGLIDHF